MEITIGQIWPVLGVYYMLLRDIAIACKFCDILFSIHLLFMLISVRV